MTFSTGDLTRFGLTRREALTLGGAALAATLTGPALATSPKKGGHARIGVRGGSTSDNLFAGGGAARGVSGNAVWGYLSGNGLLTAVTLGRIAGRGAGAMVLS